MIVTGTFTAEPLPVTGRAWRVHGVGPRGQLHPQRADEGAVGVGRPAHLAVGERGHGALSSVAEAATTTFPGVTALGGAVAWNAT